MKEPVNLLGLNRAQLEAFFSEQGEKAFRASQVMKWIHQQGVTDFQQMSNLSKVLREKLERSAVVELPEVVADRLSEDGTRKWLFQLEDGNSARPTPMRAGSRPRSRAASIPT